MAIQHHPPNLACLFIDITAAIEHGQGPLARFGAGTILDQQLGAFVAAGMTQIRVWADHPIPGLAEDLDKWRAEGLDIEVFHDRDAMATGVSLNATMLVLAHNLVATSATVHHAMARSEPTLFVRDAATSDERHERIDLNDRWTGIAVLPVQFLAELPELAEDWSLQSALLRHAVQKAVPRETLAIGPAAPFQSEIIVERGDVARWQSRMVQHHFDQELTVATPFRRWVSLPLARVVLPLLWERQEEAAQLVTWGRYALLVMAFILALLQWLPAALCLLIPLILLEEIDSQHTALSAHRRGHLSASQIYSAAWFAFPIIAIMSVEAMPFFSGFLLGGIVSIAVASTAALRSAQEIWVVTRQEAVLLALGTAIVGLSVADSALLTTLAVLASGFWRPIWSRLKAI